MIGRRAPRGVLPLVLAALLAGGNARAADRPAYRSAGECDGLPAGAPRDVIAGWNKSKTHPMGAPVDVKAGDDGTLYISEDRDGTLLVVVADMRR